MIKFVYFGRHSDNMLIVDPENKKYSYWIKIRVEPEKQMIMVQSGEELVKLMIQLIDIGYGVA